MEDYSYLGVGRSYLRELGTTGPTVEIGNASVLNFGVTEDEKKLKDFTTPGGGTRNAVKRIDSVVANITFHDISPSNIARFLYGAQTLVAGAAVTDEAHTAFPGSYVSFAKLPAATPAPTVTGAPDADTRANSTAVDEGDLIVPAIANGFIYRVETAGTTAAAPPAFGTTVGGTTNDGTAVLRNVGVDELELNVDYEVRPGGLYFLDGARISADGVPIEVSYTGVATDVVNALTTSGKEYELIFDGLNEARSGKRTKITAFRVKPGALAELALIGEDYAAPSVAIEVLQDSTKIGEGISKYFKVEFEK